MFGLMKFPPHISIHMELKGTHLVFGVWEWEFRNFGSAKSG